MAMGMTILVAYLLCVGTAVIGWFSNIVKLFNLDTLQTTEAIARCLGIPFAPLGSILGFF